MIAVLLAIIAHAAERGGEAHPLPHPTHDHLHSIEPPLPQALGRGVTGCFFYDERLCVGIDDPPPPKHLHPRNRLVQMQAAPQPAARLVKNLSFRR